MVNVIVGLNNIGKTRTLRQIAKSNLGKCTSNLCGDSTRDSFKLSENTLKSLIDNSWVESFTSDGNTLSSVYWDNGTDICLLQRKAVEIIELISKDCPIILIDEPEYCLDTNGLDAVADVLYNCTEGLNIWITTHDVTFADIPNSKYYTIKNNELKEIKRWHDWQY